MTDRTLPTGTVTFLATDIEGSTKMVQDVGPAAFRVILERHHDILRSAIGRSGGTERGTEGDSFLVMFPDAPAAVAAAVEGQRALASTDWPDGVRVRVRMGLHTGIGMLGGDDYVGVDVPLVARIAAAAHGGQILLSGATRALASTELPPGTTIRGLGEHKLRDIARPVELFQLSIDGLPGDFPPLSTAGPAWADGLPRRLTSFVGREQELDELAGLLTAGRLLTLTGPGGTGKTSLAVELATRHAADFRDGAWFVPLDAVTDPDLVPAAIAGELRLAPNPGASVADQVFAYFGDRSALLVLDNVEQVLSVATYLHDLVARTAALKLLVTSRAPLHLSAEQEYAVRPFAPPDADVAADDGLLDNPAVRLFIERAGRVAPGYRPRGTELDAVVEICRRVDGLPLGIELAASRVGLLPATSIAARLAGQLDLPGSGARDLPERQRSMQQAIAWSHDLLERPAQRLLARLSVFRGGFRLEEAERIAGSPEELGVDVLDGLATLVDHSLIRPVRGPDGPRFELLETIRTFAAGRLDPEETAEIERRHALAYRDLAEAAAVHMPGPGQLVWLDRLEADHGNLRSALSWAIEQPDVELAYRLGAAQWRFWQLRGHVDEGRREMARAMALPTPDGLESWRMRACEAAGGLAWWGGDLPEADARYRSQLDLARTVGDSQGIADALFNYLHTQVALGADVAELTSITDEAGERFRRAGDERGIARLAYARGTDGLQRRGDDVEAPLIAVLDRLEALDDEWWATQVRSNLAIAAIDRGDTTGAIRWTFGTIDAARRMGDIPGPIILLRLVTTVLLLADLADEAATVWGAYEALMDRHAVSVPPPALIYLTVPDRRDFPMSDDRYRTARARGAAMSLDEVLDYIVGVGQTLIPATG